MPKPIKDVAPRTVRLHIPTYNKILEFFRSSPSGIRGSDAIRQVLYHFGMYCDEEMKKGRTASAVDLSKAEDITLELLNKTTGNDKADN